MRISDWSSDVCSSDLAGVGQAHNPKAILSKGRFLGASKKSLEDLHVTRRNGRVVLCAIVPKIQAAPAVFGVWHHVQHVGVERGHVFHNVFHRERGGVLRLVGAIPCRSEEHTSELQSLMRISYAV